MRERVASLNLLGLVLPVVLLGLWQLVIGAGLVELDYLPTPTEIVSAFADLVEKGELWSPLAHTATAVLAAWLIAVGGGVVLGVLTGLSAAAWDWSMSSVSVLRTLPAVALVPVSLLIFGYEMTAEIAVAASVAIWPTVLSVAVAVQSVGPRLREVARTLELSWLDTVRKMILPAAYPVIVVAARLALSICVILVIVTEMVGTAQGLGYALVSKQQGLQPDAMWAYLLFIGVFGLALQVILNSAARRAMPGFAPQLRTGAA